MTAGAISRTIAQTFMHPANTYKTMLQLKDTGKSTKLTLERLLRGADAQFLLSLPHGAFHFFVIDQVKIQLAKFLPSRLNFFADFTASAISTVVCSVVSTPQMVLTDRLMAGVYPSFPDALRKIWKSDGFLGFYSGWWPALAQKIPSYALTWMFFQQLKRMHEDVLKTSPNTETNFAFGAIAAAGSVAVMIPMDTVKTRLVIQEVGCPRAYKGVTDCFIRVLKEEGIGTFYRSLPPRLMSVVPMIAIQFGVYEIMKAKFLKDNLEERLAAARLKQTVRRELRLERRSQILAKEKQYT
jgi:solute carrier family 25 S-adenosylmethionine transporter 26